MSPGLAATRCLHGTSAPKTAGGLTARECGTGSPAAAHSPTVDCARMAPWPRSDTRNKFQESSSGQRSLVLHDRVAGSARK